MLVDSPDLALDVAAGVAVFAHGRHAPDPVAWTSACGHLRRDTTVTAGLILVDGGSPTSTQRTEIREALGPRFEAARSAIVTESMGARFVVGALSLFLTRLRVFHPRDARAALVFLGLDGPGRVVVGETVGRMARGAPRFEVLGRVAGALR